MTLSAALTWLLIGLHPLDGPRAIVCVDPAPGFASMSNNDSIKHFNVTIEVGRVKNKNKNPVAEKAVCEVEEELNRQEAGACIVSEVGLAIATARLSSRLRFSSLSSRKLWTQRNQFIQEQLPLSDSQFILTKHALRFFNHSNSEKSKNPYGLVLNSPPIQFEDLVYLVSDKDKSRDRHIFVSTDSPPVKFSGSQLRASSYKVKLSDCFPVPPSAVVSNYPCPPAHQDKGEDEGPLPVTPTAPSDSAQPTLSPPAPPCLLTVSRPLPWPVLTQHLMFPSTSHLPLSSLRSQPSTNVVAFEQSLSSSQCSSPEPRGLRPQRQRRPPLYFNDNVRF